MTKPFEMLTLAEIESLSPPTRARYERWFASWMAAGFPREGEALDTFDIETERRDGWGYQPEEHLP